tara:strand:+ start:127 stop:606 length:480 start_codon:yes stop_codon:yes gene_type:complete
MKKVLIVVLIILILLITSCSIIEFPEESPETGSVVFSGLSQSPLQKCFRLKAGKTVRYKGHTIELIQCSEIDGEEICTISIDGKREVFNAGKTLFRSSIKEDFSSIELSRIKAKSGVEFDSATICLNNNRKKLFSPPKRSKTSYRPRVRDMKIDRMFVI